MKGADSIQNTNSRSNCRVSKNLAPGIVYDLQEPGGDMLFWFTDQFDWLSVRIKKKIKRLDHRNAMLEKRRCS